MNHPLHLIEQEERLCCSIQQMISVWS